MGGSTLYMFFQEHNFKNSPLPINSNYSNQLIKSLARVQCGEELDIEWNIQLKIIIISLLHVTIHVHVAATGIKFQDSQTFP